MQYVIRMQIGSEFVDCVPMQFGDQGLGLSEAGVTWMESAPIRIEVAHDELSVSVDSDYPEAVYIERAGRKRQIKPGQTIRLIASDVLRFGTQSAKIVEVFKQKATSSSPAWKAFKTASRAMMMTMAAGMLLSACSPQSSVNVTDRAGDMARISPYESCNLRNNQDLNATRACCRDIQDENDRTLCCYEFERDNPGLPCAETAQENTDKKPSADEQPLPENAPIVEPKVMGKMVAPVEPEDAAPEQPAIEEPPVPEIVPDSIPRPMGDIALSPYGQCMQTAGDDVDKLKACCLAKEDFERNMCCNELAKAHPGASCEEPSKPL